ncbi:MAG: repeat protein, partial [Pelosinus sp.]|nr:repeat protein [Pelosinus sp.]
NMAVVKYIDAWGVIDLSGNYVIPAKSSYEEMTVINHDFIGIKVNGKWGFVNKEGRTIVEPQYDTISSISSLK